MPSEAVAEVRVRDADECLGPLAHALEQVGDAVLRHDRSHVRPGRDYTGARLERRDDTRRAPAGCVEGSAIMATPLFGKGRPRMKSI